MLTVLDYYSTSVAGIEVYLFGAEENAGAPVVFCLHGRGGYAQSVFGYCRELAATGFIAVAFDQRNHGRRMYDPLGNGGWSLTHAAEMYSGFVGTAMDVSLLIDMLPARLGISTEKVGMTGFSMGGHATLAAMTLDERIAVGAPVIGSADYRRLMEMRAADNNCPPEDFSRYFTPAMQRAVERYDPICHPERFADRPLLMTNGGADTLVPAECNARFLEACRPFYTQEDRIRHSIYPGIGHDCPPEMWQEVMGWFRQWLLKA